jgi:hypothetical protein
LRKGRGIQVVDKILGGDSRRKLGYAIPVSVVRSA